MRRALLITGLAALAVGLLWIGQGTGAIAWPKASFMINQIQWVGYGVASRRLRSSLPIGTDVRFA